MQIQLKSTFRGARARSAAEPVTTRRLTLALITALAVLCLATACIEELALTKWERDVLARARAQGSSFVVGEFENPGAWRRAQDWTIRYASGSIEIMNDSQIVTSRPPDGGYRYHIARSRSRTGDKTWIYRVDCIADRPYRGDYSRRNALVMARYIAANEDAGSLMRR